MVTVDVILLASSGDRDIACFTKNAATNDKENVVMNSTRGCSSNNDMFGKVVDGISK